MDNKQIGDAVLIQVVSSNAGIFAQGSGGVGPGLIQNLDAHLSPVLNALSKPAVPGQYITLWATGLGQASDAVVLLGGVPVTPAYAGPSGIQGIDQINVAIPQDSSIPDGCYVAVQLLAGGAKSNEVSFSKERGPGHGHHPRGLSQDDMQTVENGGTLLVGSLYMSSIVSPNENDSGFTQGFQRTELAFASFLRTDAVGIFLTSQAMRVDEANYGCSAQTGSGPFGAFAGPDDVDPGPSLRLNSPDGSVVDVARSFSSYFQKQFTDSDRATPIHFRPGLWLMSLQGGATIDPFQVNFSLPPGLRWTDKSTLTAVDRKKDLTLNWAADGYRSADVTTVLVSTFGRPFAIQCTVPTRTGTLSIPASLLGQLPVDPTGGYITMRIDPRVDRRLRFAMPLHGGGSSVGEVDYRFSETLPVAIR